MQARNAPPATCNLMAQTQILVEGMLSLLPDLNMLYAAIMIGSSNGRPALLNDTTAEWHTYIKLATQDVFVFDSQSTYNSLGRLVGKSV